MRLWIGSMSWLESVMRIVNVLRFCPVALAADPETRLRILGIHGMLEVNSDAASAQSTWTQVAELARGQHHYQFAVRAVGEQGISAFPWATSARRTKMCLRLGRLPRYCTTRRRASAVPAFTQPILCEGQNGQHRR